MQQKRGVIIGNNDKLVWVSQDVIDTFVEYQKDKNFEKESGGILIGYYDSKSKIIKITDVTEPQPSDVQKRFRFLRKDFGHQRIMDSLWEESGRIKSYLGEWHTHLEKNSNPSFIDKNNWKKIALRQNNYDNSYFVIVGYERITFWRVFEGFIEKIGSL